MNIVTRSLAAGILVCASSAAHAAVITLDFEGVGDLQEVGNFYDGGGGTDYDIQFSLGSLGVVDTDAGGSGDIGNEPSPNTVLFFLDASSAILNYAAGFTTGFSFFYSSVDFGGSVNVYDGLNATGNVLASLALGPLGAGPGDPTGLYSNWQAIGVLFSGTAKSIDFGGTANYIAYDDVTLGSATPGPSPVPLPGSLPLLAGAIGLAGMLHRRKRV